MEPQNAKEAKQSVLADGSAIMAGGEAEKAADFANYFCSYAYLYHQKQMLTDHVRMNAYYSAVMQNRELFEGKVVLDVGTGSGILAIWAAKAGASRVYAIEYTDMAKHAQALVAHNNVADVVQVMQTSLEDLELPEKVDIIISEWMGYFLLRESMLDSVIRARDRWLKDDGLMFPSHATMYWAAISNEIDRENKLAEYHQSMNEWDKFKEETKQFYDVSMDVLEEQFDREQKEYYLQSAIWFELAQEHIVSTPVIIKRLDLHTCTLQDVAGVDPTDFRFRVREDCAVSGFAGWFTTDFFGRNERPCPRPVTLSTGPEVGYTHWGQQVFYLMEPIECHSDSTITGSVAMVRQTKNQRLYNVPFSFKLDGGEEQSFVYELP